MDEISNGQREECGVKTGVGVYLLALTFSDIK
jgi:hypothetical protein